jgi:hypothetical protein
MGTFSHTAGALRPTIGLAERRSPDRQEPGSAMLASRRRGMPAARSEHRDRPQPVT